MRVRLLCTASAVATTLILTVAGCGGGDDGGGSEGASDPPETSASATEPTTPETTPAPEPLGEAALKAALVTAGELGKPWFEPEVVNEQTNDEAGGICPGKPAPGLQRRTRQLRQARTDEGPLRRRPTSRPSRSPAGSPTPWRTGSPRCAAEQTRCSTFKSLDGLFIQLTSPSGRGKHGPSARRHRGLRRDTSTPTSSTPTCCTSGNACMA